MLALNPPQQFILSHWRILFTFPVLGSLCTGQRGWVIFLSQELWFYVYTWSTEELEHMGTSKLLCKICPYSSVVTVVLWFLHICLQTMSVWGRQSNILFICWNEEIRDIGQTAQSFLNMGVSEALLSRSWRRHQGNIEETLLLFHILLKNDP